MCVGKMVAHERLSCWPAIFFVFRKSFDGLAEFIPEAYFLSYVDSSQVRGNICNHDKLQVQFEKIDFWMMFFNNIIRGKKFQL